MKIDIREIEPCDCHALAMLDALTFSQPLSEQGFMAEISNDNSYTLVLLVDGVVAGYCNFWGICGEITLNNIAISEDFRGQGLGGFLLKTAMDKLIERYDEYEFVTLEVRKSNVCAISLYKKHGFEMVGERKNFYRLPTENAVLMTKRFGEVSGK